MAVPETAAPSLERTRWRIPAVPSRELALAVVLFAGFAVVAELLAADNTTPVGSLVVPSVIGVAIPLVALPRVRIPWAIALGVITWFAAVGLALGVPKVINPLPPVSDAVGAAAYFDTPYQGNQIAAILGVLVLVAVPVAIALRGRAARAQAAASWRPATTPPLSRRTLLLLGLAVLLVALTLLPDLQDVLLKAPLVPTDHSWDGANFTTWHWLQQRGAVAMRDYWFPYGYTWAFDAYPLGPVWAWLYKLAILGLLAWPLWRLSGGRTLRVVVCLVAFALLLTWQSGLLRYGTALPVGLCYAALGPARHRRLTWEHAIFGVACVVAGFAGADVLGAYAMGAVAFVLLGEWLRSPRPWRQWVRGLAVDAVPVIAVVAIILLSWVVTGSTEGNLRFYGGLNAVSAASANDQIHFGAQSGLHLVPGLRSTPIAVTFLVVLAGILQTLWNRGRDRGTAAILLAAGGLTFVVLVKFMVRPVDQILFVPLLAFAWAGILLVTRRALLVVAAAGAFAGSTFALVQTSDSFTTYAEAVRDAPAHVGSAFGLLGKRKQLAQVADHRFDLKLFYKWPEAALPGAIHKLTNGQTPPFAVLGDWALLYVWLNQTPPWQIELYDASRVAEQNAMIAAMEKENLQLLVWRMDFNTDGVPYSVRNPILYTWAVRNFSPVGEVPTTAFLARRKPGQPVNYEWWRAHFPTPYDIGYVPSMSDGASLPACTSGKGCVSYAIVRGRPRKTGEAIVLNVDGRGGRYPVLMRSRGGRDTYAVRLDRMWFWPIIGPHPRITSGTPGYTVQVRRVDAGTDLY